jgi:hypothetical protein
VADIGVCILKQEVSSFVQDRLQSSDRISKGDWLYP